MNYRTIVEFDQQLRRTCLSLPRFEFQPWAPQSQSPRDFTGGRNNVQHRFRSIEEQIKLKLMFATLPLPGWPALRDFSSTESYMRCAPAAGRLAPPVRLPSLP